MSSIMYIILSFWAFRRSLWILRLSFWT